MAHGKDNAESNDHRVRVWMGIALILFLIAAAASFAVLKPSDSHIVEVVQDGKILYAIDLDAAVNEERVVVCPNGSSNTILIEDGGIRVSEAGCPDQTCVKMGRLRSKSLPIVCLPNRLVIQFAE